MIKTSVICDECGAERREVNHWFSAVYIRKVWGFIPLDSVTPDVETRHDLCGQQCATATFQRLLSTGTVKKGQPCEQAEKIEL